MTKKILVSMASVIAAMLLFLAPGMNSTAADTEDTSDAADNTVKVAYFDLGSYYTVDEKGNVDSYDKAYLQMISEYTGMEFEYVDCGSWEHALEMLRSHEVDLVGTMQWTQEREDQYAICDANYGYTVAELAALGDSSYIYEDYSQLSGAVVGYMENYVIADYLDDLMEQQGISFDVRKYSSQKQLDAALEQGEIDLIAANAHAIHSDWKIIEKFAYAPFYFASWKGNEALTQTISEAIIKINMHQDEFDDKLIKEYFPRMVSSPYNKTEMDCVAKSKVYTIYFDDDTRPLAWYDKDNDKMEGILPDICAQLEQKTGLHFEMRPVSQKPEHISDTDVSYYLYQEEYDEVADKEDGRSKAINSESFLLYHRSGKAYNADKQASYRVAVPVGRDVCKEYLREQYPNYTIVEYDTPEQCVKHLQSGDVDLFFLSSNVTNDVLITEDISDITSIPTSAATFGIALQFSGGDAETLADITDKGRKLIEEEDINNIILKYVTYTAPRATLSYFIKENFAVAMVIISIVLLLLFFLVALIIYAKVIRSKNRQIQEADVARRDFFSRMSHDMRTPMNGILGMIELTRQADSLEEVRQNMDKAASSGEYMLSLINDTLDLQRMESGKLQMEPEIVRSGDFFENLTEMVNVSAKRKHVQLSVKNINLDYDSYIRIDVVRVKQIFNNLLSNAIKFTPEGGTVELILECLQMEGSISHNKIIVRDTGIGMSQEFMQNGIYKAYEQEQNPMTNQYAGSGLGLAIVRNLIDMMGGRIEVESEPGEGSRFTIYLDVEHTTRAEAAEAAKEQRQLQSNIQQGLRGKRILLCEDHPLNAEIVSRLLKKTGCQVVWAMNGEAGVKEFTESEPGYFDAILMDIRMPVMDGLAAAAAIRGQERSDAGEIPIIAMTANAYESDKQQSREAGMNEHLAKPIEPNILYSVLTRYICSK